MTKEDAKVEYIDVSNNLRHWNSLRFVELTVYMAISGAMLNVVFGKPTPPPWGVGLLMKASGILVSLLFLILHERTMSWWYQFLQRAAELEEILEFDQYRRRPQGHKLTSRWAISLFFIVMILFWAVSIFIS